MINFEFNFQHFVNVPYLKADNELTIYNYENLEPNFHFQFDRVQNSEMSKATNEARSE